MTNEVWKVIPGMDDYEVSNFGNVRSWTNRKCGKLMKQYTCSQGYKKMKVAGKVMRVHSLVMLAFVGKCPADMEVRHLDGNPANNQLSNLSYGTHTQNMIDKNLHGTHNKGERNGSSKLTEPDFFMIRMMREFGWSIRFIADVFGVGKTTISNVLNGVSYATQ